MIDMEDISRRRFLKRSLGAGAGGVLAGFPDLAHALEKGLVRHPVIWVQGQSCSGCSISLFNGVSPKIADILLKVVSLQAHPNFMVAEGSTALENIFAIAKEYTGRFSIFVEGAVPVSAGGRYCVVGNYNRKKITMLDVLKDLGSMAGSIVAVGSCAAYGGIPASVGNETDAKGVMDVIKMYEIRTPVVNIPGCPAHPDWIVGTLVHLLQKGIPELDDHGRPTLFYGETIHENCPRKVYYEKGEMARDFTQPGCRMHLGCQGAVTSADCGKRKWNSGMNWCVNNALCIGCTEPGFQDRIPPY